MNNTTANGNIIHFSLGLKVTHLGGVHGRAQRSTVCKMVTILLNCPTYNDVVGIHNPIRKSVNITFIYEVSRGPVTGRCMQG